VSHANARLTVHTRAQIVALRRAGYAPAWIAEVIGVSRATVYKWLRRFEDEGEAGLADRSSRPHRTHPKLTPAQITAVCRLRRTRAWGPHRIGDALQLARSTVYAVLRRRGLQRLDQLHRSTRAVIRMVQTTPGELVHLDVKKFGRIPPGGGKRMAPGFRETGAGPHSGARLGYEFAHVAVDGYSRYAYVEILPDERGETTAGFLARALRTFEAAGITTRCLMTDNGANYRSHAFRRVTEAGGLRHKRTRPYRPQTNGKAEAFIRTLQREWAYIRLYRSNAERLRALPRFLATYNGQRTHTGLGGLTPLARLRQ
jgi:transposase InsO family protein